MHLVGWKGLKNKNCKVLESTSGFHFLPLVGQYGITSIKQSIKQNKLLSGIQGYHPHSLFFSRKKGLCGLHVGLQSAVSFVWKLIYLMGSELLGWQCSTWQVGKSHPSNETLEVLVVGLFPGCWFVGLLVVLCHCVSSSNRRAESNVTIILQPVISSDRH